MQKRRNLAQMMPVEIEGRAYRNVYCALCNYENVKEDHFWRLKEKKRQLKGNKDCEYYLKRFQRDREYNMDSLETMNCYEDAIFYPSISSDALRGRNRLGKLCLFNSNDANHAIDRYQREAAVYYVVSTVVT